MISLAAVCGIVTSPRALDPRALVLGRPIATGRFGTCNWAEYDGARCVAKRASAEFATDDDILAQQRAREYLNTENEINALLCERAQLYSSLDAHSSTLAPFLGSTVKDGCRYLIWRPAGEATLEDYLRDGRMSELARALGCDLSALPRRVLHDVLSALAHVHACGVAHRDVKPANLLIDADAQRVRLIDFGAAADCAGWLWAERRGLRADRVPASLLFAAAGDLSPNGVYDRAGWYKYDVYAAALVWLCVVVPALAAEDCELLEELRMTLKAHEHDPEAWKAACTDPRASGCAVPAADGFGDVYGWAPPRDEHSFPKPGHTPTSGEGREQLGRQQTDAWQLLTRLLSLDPARRPSAAEALLGHYLNRDCTAGELPLPAPEPWTLEAVAAATGAGPARLVSEECPVP